MKVKVLLEKVKEFRNLLEEHYNLWKKSLNKIIPDYPIINVNELKEQQKQLFRIFYLIDEYITIYSKGRLKYYPATGIEWDIYRSSISDNVAQIKGDSITSTLLDIEGIISILETENPEKEIITNKISSKNKKVFISHGPITNALNELEKFLGALGVDTIIVEHEPSLGKALDDLVEEQMTTCFAVIVLATKDDLIEDKKEQKYYQPRPNVIHEIGLAQEKFENRIIYLKEKGCVLPSNINPKVWEDFTQDNMGGAFIKIVKELRSMKIIE